MPKRELSLKTPWMNAAGSLGFAPELHGAVDLSMLGAFVTNPISLRARSPAQGRRFASFPGGFLLHTGHPNPGFKTAIRQYASRWRRSPIPVLVHLLVQSPQEAAEMIYRLESIESVTGVEVGLPLDVEAGSIREYIEATTGELPILIRIPADRTLELVEPLSNSDIAGVSLAPRRGTLPDSDGGFMHGRLYGPACFPQGLADVELLSKSGVQVIGAGGVTTKAQADAMLRAGAIAVQLDCVLWRGGWPNTLDITANSL